MNEVYRTRVTPLGRAAIAAGLVLAAREGVARLREANLRGDVVLITGGSRGLGLAMARAFADAGCRLSLCARDADELERARLDLVQRGADVMVTPCDVSVRTEVERWVNATERRMGGVDILVNNAGAISVGPLDTVTPQGIADSMNVTLWGMVNAVWEVMPRLREKHSGHIVNITSIGGKVAVPHLLPYSTAKFAAVGLSEGLRAELARDGVGVTTVVPGLMRTGSYLRALFQGRQGLEFILFGAMANLPLFSVSAESAARAVVRAVKRNTAELVISPQARILALFHGIFPGATTNILGTVARILPDATPEDADRRPGLDLNAEVAHPALADPLGLGRKAASDLNEEPPAYG